MQYKAITKHPTMDCYHDTFKLKRHFLLHKHNSLAKAQVNLKPVFMCIMLNLFEQGNEYISRIGKLSPFT